MKKIASVSFLSIISAASWLLFSSFDPQRAEAQTIPTSGLVAHWKFDEGSGTVAGDSSGNGNTGTLTNGPTWITGQIGSALNFDGVNDWVNAGAGASLNPSSAITISAWVKTNNNTAFQKIVSRQTSKYALGLDGSSRTFLLQLKTGVTSAIFGSTIPANNTWYHVVGTWDGANMNLYVNGVSDATPVAKTGTMAADSAVTEIGSRGGGTQHFWNGSIDDLRIYDRALSASEVQSLYSAGIGTPPPLFDFALSNSGNVSVVQGQSVSDTIIATLISSSTQNTNFSVSGLPQNATGTFSQTSCSPTCSTTLTISTLATTPVGNYTITVTAVGGSVTRTTSFTLTVNAAPVFDFSLTNSGNISVTQGQSGQNTITATLVSAPTQNTSFSVSGLPSNTAATFSQPSCSPTCSTTLPLSTLASTPVGNHTITVTAVGGSVTRTTSFTLTVNASVPPPPPTSVGLVAHWTFDEGVGTIAGDSSGNGNTGILTNGPTWTTGGALSLDGVNDWVNAGTGASLNPSNAITISAWVNLRRLSAFQKIVARHNTILKYAFGIDGTNKLVLQINSGSTSAVFGNTALSANTWYHVVGTWDGSNMKLYLNGVSDAAPVAKTGTMASDSETVSIGARANGSQHFLNGFLDDLRIYNRALSATEVQSLYAAGPGTPPPPSSQIGQVAGPLTWPTVGIHMMLLRTGEVLAWDAGLTAHVWNPTTGAFTSVPNNFTDLFCAGHTHLPDGRILVVGGHVGGGVLGVPDVNIFDPLALNWTAAPPMAGRRWYPTATTLSDGRVLVTSGADGCFDCIVPIPEIYDPQSNSWTQLTKANLAVPFYAYMFLLPDGRIVDAGADDESVITRVLNVATQTWTTVEPVAVDGGSAAMYLPGKLIKSGSSTDTPDTLTPASATTYVLDTTQSLPIWRQTPSMNYPRVFHTLTLLPDGNVLVTGGSRIASSSDTSLAVLEIEVWSPVTETWTTLASMQVPRLYHSTALLLPDARVLIAGSGRSLGPDQLNAEIYSPPYLFNGPRPTITSAPATITYGAAFTAATPDALNIAKVSLIAPGAVTHTFDHNQRLVELQFQASPNGLTVQAPTNSGVAPPGYYMLFILDTNGVPSVASFVRLQ